MTNGNTSSREKNKHLPMVLRLKIRGEDKQNFVEFAVLLSLAVTGILTLKKTQKTEQQRVHDIYGVFFFFIHFTSSL